MTRIKVNTRSFKAKIGAYKDFAQEMGIEILVCNANKPVILIVPVDIQGHGRTISWDAGKYPEIKDKLEAMKLDYISIDF